jgi:hypothetical protein
MHELGLDHGLKRRGRMTRARATSTVLVLAIFLGALASATTAAAQTPADVISFLVTNQSVQTGDFQRDQAAAAATRDTIARALLVNLSAVPIQTSSSGFAYRLDSELGTMRRVSDSFGTFFVERAAASGHGRFSLGVSGSAAGYDRLDGLALTDGSLVTTSNRFTDEAAPFDADTLTLRVSTKTMTLFAAYGVTDRLEVSGALPIVQLHVEGTRVNVYRGQSTVQALGSGDASGVADAAVRAPSPRPTPPPPPTPPYAPSTSSSRAAPAPSPSPAKSGCRPATRRRCSAPGAPQCA